MAGKGTSEVSWGKEEGAEIPPAVAAAAPLFSGSG